MLYDQIAHDSWWGTISKAERDREHVTMNGTSEVVQPEKTSGMGAWFVGWDSEKKHVTVVEPFEPI